MASDQISVPEFDYEETEGNQMRVTATVANDADENQQVTLTISVDAGDQHEEKSTDLTVRANDAEETEAVFDVDVDEFERDGSLDFDWDAQAE